MSIVKGTDGRLNFSGSLIATANYTIAVWVKAPAISGTFLSYVNNATGANLIALSTDTGAFRHEVRQEYTGLRVAGVAATVDVWEPAVLYTNGSSAYIETPDGDYGGSFFGVYQAEDSPSLSIGSALSGDFDIPVGSKIASVAIYSAILSTADRDSLIAGSNPADIASADLVELWIETAGVALDGSSNLTSWTGQNGLVLSVGAGSWTEDDADTVFTAASTLTIDADLNDDSNPDSVAKGGTLTVEATNASATGLAKTAFTATLGGQSITVDSITEAAGVYTLALGVGADIALQAGTHELAITENAVTATVADVPLLVQSGYTKVDLTDPVARPKWISGSNYLSAVEVWHTDNNIYSRDSDITSSTTEPADGVDGWSLVGLSGSVLDGYTGDAPVTGDDLEHATVADLTVDATGQWVWATEPSSTQTIDSRVVQADGTVGVSADAVYTVEGSAVNSAPTDIQLSASTVLTTSGLNAAVGSLSATDVDAGDTLTFSLVAGTGDTDNASFSISGTSLLCDDPETLGAGTYSVRVQVSDGSESYEEAFVLRVAEPGEAAGRLTLARSIRRSVARSMSRAA